MTNQFNILAISGSLRRDSYNSALLRKAKVVAPKNLILTIWNLNEIPLYNNDLIPDEIPNSVLELRNAAAETDALLIACPEYNYSFSGVLKNALDWLSTDAINNLMEEKIVALMGASRGGFGTVRAQLHLRQVLLAMNADVLRRPEIHVRNAGRFINEYGEFIDERKIEQIKVLLGVLGRKLADS